MGAVTMTEVAGVDDVVFENMTSRMSSNIVVIDWSDSTELDMAGENARLAAFESVEVAEETVPFCSALECTTSSPVGEPSVGSEQTAEPPAETNVVCNVVADAAPTATPEPATVAEDTESAPMLPGLRLQNVQATGATMKAPTDAQASDISTPESNASVSSAKSDEYAVSKASTSPSERPFSLIEELRGRPQSRHLFQSVDGGAETYMGRGTPHQRVATPLEDILGPGCTHTKGQDCPVHYTRRTAKSWLQTQGDALRQKLQDDFKEHDRERAGCERQYKFLCRRYGEAKAQAIIDYHKDKVRTLRPLFRSVQKGRLAIAFQDEDEWLDE